MAKRHQRGNREKRKPKSAKPKPAVQVSPFGGSQGIGDPKSGAGKRGR